MANSYNDVTLRSILSYTDSANSVSETTRKGFSHIMLLLLSDYTKLVTRDLCKETKIAQGTMEKYVRIARVCKSSADANPQLDNEAKRFAKLFRTWVQDWSITGDDCKTYLINPTRFRQITAWVSQKEVRDSC
jgi:hypothetical protein